MEMHLKSNKANKKNICRLGTFFLRQGVSIRQLISKPPFFAQRQQSFG